MTGLLTALPCGSRLNGGQGSSSSRLGSSRSRRAAAAAAPQPGTPPAATTRSASAYSSEAMTGLGASGVGGNEAQQAAHAPSGTAHQAGSVTPLASRSSRQRTPPPPA